MKAYILDTNLMFRERVGDCCYALAHFKRLGGQVALRLNPAAGISAEVFHVGGKDPAIPEIGTVCPDWSDSAF